MDMPPLQTRTNRPPGQPPTSWNGAPGANSVTPQVIATTALPALARQDKEVEQRNPRKRSAACQSAKTTTQRAAGNRDNEEQIATTSRKCNALKSNVITTASDDDSTQDVSPGSNHAARSQSTVTWASNVAETQSDRPQSSLAKPDRAGSDRTTNIQAIQSPGTPRATPAFPTNLINIISDITGQPSPAPMKQEFAFELTKEAAEKNYCLLKKYGLDLSRAIDAQKSSPLSYGSEFKPPHTLKRIYHNHPLWPRMEQLLINGSQWPLDEISEEDRKADLHEALAFGNHKGAASKPELLKELITADVRHGYGLVIPRDKVARIPNACLAPMNIMHQFTLDAGGNIIDKERLTHDQSFKWQSGTSVNNRVDKSKLQRCMYGRCLMRLLCWIVAARRQFPNKPIVLQKIDVKSAYRRCHLNAETAIKTITQLTDDELCIIMLRLTFGGAPCPFEWNIISESIRDLANAILHDDTWDPTTLYAPSQHLVPSMILMDDSIPFAEGAEQIVDIPIDPRGTGDIYIDDFIETTIVIDGTDNVVRCERATLLAIDVTARPKHINEPIPREDLEARNKLSAEAGLEEQKTVLGWLIDTRRLLLSLPNNKFVAWTELLSSVLTRGTTTAKETESIIGRLGHIGMAVPFVHHFLSRLRDLQTRAKSRRAININEECRNDLLLMINIIKIAYRGISLNIIVYRRPTHVYRSDSCPAGLGGYSDSGFAWRYYLPPHLQFRATNNLLEHLAAIITPWIDIIKGRLQPGNCALSMTDSTTSEGWLRKTNFSELGDNPLQATVRLEAARMHAMHYMTLGIREYSQWFKGEANVVADALSRDNDRSDEELTHIFRTHCPSQIPQHFEIQPLPNEIISWLTALLLKLPANPQYNEKHTRTKLGRGTGGQPTAVGLDSATHSSMTSPALQKSSSSVPLPWLCAKHDFQDHLMTDWLMAQSQVPSHMYVRPSGSTADPIHHSMTTENLDSFYNGN